jgi:ATP-binding cassette subfamily B protein
MMAQFFPPNRRALVPEVVQTSAMDCGPATLKAMLEGFNIPVSYGRLREACQTDVDGTSIDTIEEVAKQLGLNAEQIMLPADHLLLPEAEALPAIVVVKKPNGLTHFVVIWQEYGQFLQVMDPAVGRRWLPRQRLLNELYQHQFPVPLAAWREWAGSEGFVAPLRRRLSQLRLEPPAIDQLINTALTDSDWYGLAALDAATRMGESIVQAGGVERGAEAAAVLHRFLAPAHPDSGGLALPPPFWSVAPLPAEALEPDSEPHLTMRGAVLIRVTGLRDEAAGLFRRIARPPLAGFAGRPGRDAAPPGTGNAHLPPRRWPPLPGHSAHAPGPLYRRGHA